MRLDGNKRTIDYQGKGIALGPDGGLMKNLRVYHIENQDLASVANGAVGTLAIACAGVVAGDVVLGVAPNVAPAAGISFDGQVTAADTITIVVRNNSGGAYDPAGTVDWTLVVLQRQT